MEINLDKFELKSGSHASIEDGACIMEMVSYLANEPWSDHPKCACPIITEYAVRLNDKFNDEHRQKMKEFIPLLINTRSRDEVQIARKRLLYWRNVTATYPLLLDLIKLPELAEQLRKFGNNAPDMLKASLLLKENKKKIRSSADADATAYAYASASADAYASADADATADAYADASAYATAYREKVAAICLDTLRMAIEVDK